MKEVIKMKFRGKNKRKIGKDIQELRLSLGETQKVFGARINVSQTSVMNWEKGRYLPNYATAKNFQIYMNKRFWKINKAMYHLATKDKHLLILTY